METTTTGLTSAPAAENTFKMELKIRNKCFKIEVPVKLPFLETEVPELVQLIITSFSLPIFVEDGG